MEPNPTVMNLFFPPSFGHNHKYYFDECTGKECVWVLEYLPCFLPHFRGAASALPDLYNSMLCHAIMPPCIQLVGSVPKAPVMGQVAHWPWSSLAWEVCPMQELCMRWWLSEWIRPSYSYLEFETHTRKKKKCWEGSRSWEVTLRDYNNIAILNSV